MYRQQKSVFKVPDEVRDRAQQGAKSSLKSTYKRVLPLTEHSPEAEDGAVYFTDEAQQDTSMRSKNKSVFDRLYQKKAPSTLNVSKDQRAISQAQLTAALRTQGLQDGRSDVVSAARSVRNDKVPDGGNVRFCQEMMMAQSDDSGGEGDRRTPPDIAFQRKLDQSRKAEAAMRDY